MPVCSTIWRSYIWSSKSRFCSSEFHSRAFGLGDPDFNQNFRCVGLSARRWNSWWACFRVASTSPYLQSNEQWEAVSQTWVLFQCVYFIPELWQLQLLRLDPIGLWFIGFYYPPMNRPVRYHSRLIANRPLRRRGCHVPWWPQGARPFSSQALTDLPLPWTGQSQQYHGCDSIQACAA